MRHLFAALALVALSGCAMGYGVAFPGAGTKHKPGISHGFQLGGRLGQSTAQLGGRAAQTGIGAELRGHYLVSALQGRVGLGVSAAFASDSFTYADGTASLVTVPLSLSLEAMPIDPLVVWAGGAVASTKLSWQETPQDLGWKPQTFAGIGMSVPFRSPGFFLGVEWRRRPLGTVALPGGGAQESSADIVLGQFEMIW